MGRTCRATSRVIWSEAVEKLPVEIAGIDRLDRLREINEGLLKNLFVGFGVGQRKKVEPLNLLIALVSRFASKGDGRLELVQLKRAVAPVVFVNHNS